VPQKMWLAIVLTQRELSQRYRGTALGAVWPFLYSGLLLVMFTFVFSLILKVKWSQGPDAKPYESALMIFAGLVPYLFVSEIITRASTCITSVPNFVKKVKFPLELLPIVVVSSAAVLAFINCLILMLAVLVLWQGLPSTVFFLPLLLVPLLFFATGIAYLFGALGVFFKDLAQVSPLISQLLMFLAPVCYPISIVPPVFADAININPITWFVVVFRDLTLNGATLSFSSWISHTVTYALFTFVSYQIFNRLRKSFADLL
jgi:lipopolysaccharide transport system permease protein